MSHDPYEWRRKAACTTSDPNWFFDPLTEPRALNVCRYCPVQIECLEHALTQPEPYGVWGGKTERQRQRLLRQRALQHPDHRLREHRFPTNNDQTP